MTTLQDTMKSLASTIAQLTTDGEKLTTAIEGLSLFRRDEPPEPISAMYEPSLCMVAQGAKHVVLGSESHIYDSSHYLITSLHLPTIVQITEASADKPLLGLRITFDLHEVTQMLVDSDLPAPRQQKSSRAMATGEVTSELADAARRLVKLLGSPRDIAIMSPIIQKEIIYRLLTGDQGPRLRQIAASDSQSQQIGRVVSWLKDNYDQPLKVEELARQANMSTSAFHHHFRSMTALSPLQYQKQLRLSEARRLMLIEYMDATTAAFEVGYESPSQFSREYSRMFGAPPLRDITAMREQTTTPETSL